MIDGVKFDSFCHVRQISSNLLLFSSTWINSVYFDEFSSNWVISADLIDGVTFDSFVTFDLGEFMNMTLLYEMCQKVKLSFDCECLCNHLRLQRSYMQLLRRWRCEPLRQPCCIFLLLRRVWHTIPNRPFKGKLLASMFETSYKQRYYALINVSFNSEEISFTFHKHVRN